MKLTAEIDGSEQEVEISRDGRKVTAAVNGRVYELEVTEPEKNVQLLKVGGRVFEAYTSPRTGPDGPVHVRIAAAEFDVRLIDPKKLRGSRGGGDHADGAAEIRTAMPGKVVRLLVDPGAAVEKGDGVLVVEAMKMQNELKSPKAGVVNEFRVEEGATVAAGDILAVIE